MGNRQKSRPLATGGRHDAIRSAKTDSGDPAMDILAEACAARLRRPAGPPVPLDPEHALAHWVSRELNG